MELAGIRFLVTALSDKMSRGEDFIIGSNEILNEQWFFKTIVQIF